MGIETKDIERRIKNCILCRLHRSRRNPVPGEGPVPAEIVFCGEAPGATEDRLGRPFVGAAGQFLNTLLEMAGIKREKIFITNVVKCRPPGNRTPRGDEIAACVSNYLFPQLEKLRPRLVVALGRIAASALLGRPVVMEAEHGDVVEWAHGRIRAQLFITYHPAAALYGGKTRTKLREDFIKLCRLVGQGNAKKQ